MALGSGMHTVNFTQNDVASFCAASHDRNPLHMSAAYARKTAYGQPVVFGVLGALACLGYLPLRPGAHVAKIVCEFLAPMFADVPYQITVAENAQQINIVLADGSRELTKVAVTLGIGAAASMQSAAEDASYRSEAAQRHEPDFVKTLAVNGSYAPVSHGLDDLVARFGIQPTLISQAQIATLLWASYLVGMELPGERALFYRLALNFQQPLVNAPEPLRYAVNIKRFDPRFNLLKMSAQLTLGDGSFAGGEIWSFVRPRAFKLAPVDAADQIEATLSGNVALVVGASRGLGAAMVQALAQRGCTVLATYRHSRAEAEQLQAQLASAPGAVVLIQGDGSDLAWCEAVRDQIVRDYGRLDFLVCNACPALLPLWIEPNSVQRINTYVAQSVALVSVPMAALLDLVAASGGWNIVISSEYVKTIPGQWPHYISAKYAIEGLTRAAALHHTTVKYLIVRPPRLATDFSSSPIAGEAETPPATIATTLAARLEAPGAPGSVELLETFDQPAIIPV